MTSPVQGVRVQSAVELVSRALRAHGGGAELVSATDAGRTGDQAVTLRLTGLCRGCPYWPVTLEMTIAPLMRRELGAVTVDIDGRRISDDAKRRLIDLGVAPRLPPISALMPEAADVH